MKIIIGLIAVVISIMFLLNSCNTTETKDDQLSSFMLGGIYFIDGYGGMERFVEIMAKENRTTKKELVAGYKQYLEFPFETSQKTEILPYLKNFWDITDKASLLKQIEVLKTRELKHKAWDYGRLINLVANGYATEFLTKEEVLKITKEILSLARGKYSTWSDYYKSYNAGLKDWDETGEQTKSFGKLTKNILSNEKSIYNILPLHTIIK